jgi:hypothetical protein
LLYRWGGFFSGFPCTNAGNAAATLTERVSGAAPLLVSGAYCDAFTQSLRSWATSAAAASPSSLTTAAALPLSGAGGVSISLWTQVSCVQLSPAGPYLPCGSAQPITPPNLTLKFTSNVSAAARLSLSLIFTNNGTVTTAVAWGGCLATVPAAVSPLPGGQLLLTLTVGPQGGVALYANGAPLLLATNGHASCYSGYPWLRNETGTFLLSRTNSLLSTGGFGDFFGFTDLQVSQTVLQPADVSALAGAAPSPPPPPATGTASYALFSCGAALAHRYTSAGGAVVLDGAGGWNAERLDAAGGTLDVPVPTPAGPSELVGAQGLSVRALFALGASGTVPGFEWLGFSSWNGSSTFVANSFTGVSASYKGLGTAASPAGPAAAGAYTTWTLGPSGTRIYVGGRLWAWMPRVAFAPGTQGAYVAANRITAYDATLLDFQVYNTELSPARVVGLAAGVAPSGC